MRRRTIGFYLALLAILGPVWDAPGAQAGGKLDLRLKEARPMTGIDGSWTYQPLDGSDPYSIQIRATPGGFYEYAGKREGTGALVLQLDRASEGAQYRGEVTAAFDPCIPAGARFSVGRVSERIELESVFPVGSAFEPRPPGPCSEAARYYVVAAGRGEDVRIRPAKDLGVTRPPGEPPPDRATGSRTAPNPATVRDQNEAAASLSFGVPSVQDGTEVTILGSLQDARGRLWHHVKVVSGPGNSDTGGPPGIVAGEGDRTEDLPGKTNGDAGAERGAGKTAKKAAPPSGYVPAASVVCKWSSHLERTDPGSAASEPARSGS